MKALVLASMALSASLGTAMADCHGGRLWTKGGANVKITVGDGIPDPVRVFPRHVQGQNFTFAITDSDSNVLAYTTGNTIDLEGAGAGECLVYGVAYAGDLNMQTGVSVHDLTASECIDISKNHIAIVRTPAKEIDGGWIISDSRGRSTVRINLNDAYPVRAYHTSTAVGSSYSYVITDYKGTVLAYPPANQFDFSSAPAGVCRIYGVSHTGTLSGETGIPISEVMSDEDNQQLSHNYIRVIRYD